MNSGLIPPHDSQRLQALRSYRIAGTLHEPLFDELALITARLFDTPMALVSLVEAEHVWFKAAHGFPEAAAQVPRTDSLCSAVILRDQLTIFEDLRQHPCDLVNARVADLFHLRFYAGHPLTTAHGYHIGVLCILDTEARALTPTQQTVLSQLARLVMLLIDLRASVAESQDIWEQLQQAMKAPLRLLLIAANQLSRASSASARQAHWKQIHILLASAIEYLT